MMTRNMILINHTTTRGILFFVGKNHLPCTSTRLLLLLGLCWILTLSQHGEIFRLANSSGTSRRSGKVTTSLGCFSNVLVLMSINSFLPKSQLKTVHSGRITCLDLSG